MHRTQLTVFLIMTLLNGILGLIVEHRYTRDGPVTAAGVHFWTDIVFHGLWGVF